MSLREYFMIYLEAKQLFEEKVKSIDRVSGEEEKKCDWEVKGISMGGVM